MGTIYSIENFDQKPELIITAPHIGNNNSISKIGKLSKSGFLQRGGAQNLASSRYFTLYRQPLHPFVLNPKKGQVGLTSVQLSKCNKWISLHYPRAKRTISRIVPSFVDLANLFTNLDPPNQESQPSSRTGQRSS